jgi:hypothetical protein
MLTNDERFSLNTLSLSKLDNISDYVGLVLIKSMLYSPEISIATTKPLCMSTDFHLGLRTFFVHKKAANTRPA